MQVAAEEGWERHEVPQVRTAVIPRQWSGEAGKRRFQESSVDEVSFLGEPAPSDENTTKMLSECMLVLNRISW